MVIPDNEMVVIDVAGDYARVQTTNSAHRQSLVRMGFVEEYDRLSLPLKDKNDRAKVVQMLIGFGALFSDGRDWSPAELVAYYRELGLVSGSYRVITWRNPNDYFVSKR